MKSNLITIAACLLIILFVYAGLSKLLDYSSFRFELGRSPYVSAIAGFTAWAMPTAELVAALLLTFKSTRYAGFCLSFFLMVLFTGYIYAMLNYSPFLPCSCGGVLELMSWQQHFYFNLFFVAVSACGVLLTGTENNTAQPITT